MLLSNFFLGGAGGGSGSADGACLADDIECTEMHDRLGMEAIRSLHQQLDDDENGNIDLTESDDVSYTITTTTCLFIFILQAINYLKSKNFFKCEYFQILDLLFFSIEIT